MSDNREDPPTCANITPESINAGHSVDVRFDRTTDQTTAHGALNYRSRTALYLRKHPK